MSESIIEEDFELQRKLIKDNAYDFDYHDTDKFSIAFRNKYPKIFNNSLGYKEVLEYSKDFGDFNLTLISYDYGLRSLSLNLGYGNLVRLLKKYEEFFDTIDEKVPVPFFLRELTLSAGSSMRKRKENADDIDTIFRKCIMYTLPKLNICSTEEEYSELFSKFGFSFLDVNNLDDLYKIDDDTVVINKKINNIIGHYGLSNLKRFASENNAFDEEFGGLKGEFLDYLYDDSDDLPFSYEPSYQQFIDCLRERLIRRNNYVLSYEFLKGPVREELSNLFLPDDAPETLRNLFYTRSLSLSNLQDNPEWIPYLKNAYLPCCFIEHYLFPYSFPVDSLVNFSTKFGNDEVLRSLAKYYSFLNATKYTFVLHNNLDYFSDFETYMDVNVYDFIRKNMRIINWNRFLPDEFKNNHIDIFLDDNAPSDLKDLFYKRKLTLDDIKKHPEYVEYLIDKNIDVSIDHSLIYENFGTSKKIMELILTYGNRFMEIGPPYGLHELIRNGSISEIKDALNDVIRKQILNGEIIYTAEDKSLLGPGYESMFLSSDAPDDLKKIFYSGKLDFKYISSNPSWLPYLENVDLRLVLSYSMAYYSDSIDKFYKLFGEKANKLIVHKASTIDDMFIREKVDLMYDWYLKTGRTFIPSSVVMLNFDFNDADKFF